MNEREYVSTGYRIRVCHGGSEIEVEGDKDFVLQTYEKLNEDLFDGVLESASPVIQESNKGSTPVSGSVKSNASELSINEYIRQKNPETYPDKALVIAAYRYKCGLREFTSADIEAGFTQALLPKSKNFNRDINANKKKGFMAESGNTIEGRKAFYVTSTGLDYVEQELGE
jgi:hypothetical protein